MDISFLTLQFILPVLALTAFAAPQYGPAPQAVEIPQDVSFSQWASLSPVEFTNTHFDSSHQHVEATPQISSGQWATASGAAQTAERPQIEEIQRQWEKFIE